MKANQYVGQFLETLDALDKEGKYVPGMIMSSPGFGKTTTIEKWCEFKDYNLLTLIASNFSSDDILGIQSVKDGELHRLTPSWFNELTKLAENGKRNVLFLDEISATDAYIQAPLFNLIFNHDLAGKKLPKNTLIVSAGNYSEELGNTFKMTAPLVNRFMVLNLINDDFSLMEILDGGIRNIKTKKEFEDYIGINEPKDKKYSFSRFTDWIKDNRTEFKFGKAEFTEDTSMGGLLGFTSLRSFSYSMMFAESFMGKFNSDIWMRIVGDTLGVSNKREGKPMREVLRCNEKEFTRVEGSSDNKVKTIGDICDLITKSGELSKDLLSDLEEAIKNITISDITTADLTKFTTLSAKYTNDEKMRYLSSTLTSKLEL